jgi:hypothetical protein
MRVPKFTNIAMAVLYVPLAVSTSKAKQLHAMAH